MKKTVYLAIIYFNLNFTANIKDGMYLKMLTNSQDYMHEKQKELINKKRKYCLQAICLVPSSFDGSGSNIYSSMVDASKELRNEKRKTFISHSRTINKIFSSILLIEDEEKPNWMPYPNTPGMIHLESRINELLKNKEEDKDEIEYLRKEHGKLYLQEQQRLLMKSSVAILTNFKNG